MDVTMAREKLIAEQYNLLYQRCDAEAIFELENGDKLSLDFLGEKKKGESVMKSFKLFINYFSETQRVPLKELMNMVERAILIRTLSQVNGNLKSAAKSLGLKYTTLHEKIKKYNIRFQKEPMRY